MVPFPFPGSARTGLCAEILFNIKSYARRVWWFLFFLSLSQHWLSTSIASVSQSVSVSLSGARSDKVSHLTFRTRPRHIRIQFILTDFRFTAWQLCRPERSLRPPHHPRYGNHFCFVAQLPVCTCLVFDWCLAGDQKFDSWHFADWISSGSELPRKGWRCKIKQVGWYHQSVYQKERLENVFEGCVRVSFENRLMV